MHYWDDYIYLEIVDPKTGEVLPDGEVGEIVITTLRKQGAPLIRYRTHDLSRIVPGDCPCGSPFPRLCGFCRRGRSGVFPLRCWCIWRSMGRRICGNLWR